MEAPLLLDRVLVTGGCGFLGYALVRQLLADPECGEVHVLDRDTGKNRHDGAHYEEVDICDRQALEDVFGRLNPSAVFHLASPNFSFPARGRGDFYQTNVRGTQALLDVAASCASARAFVNTSSIDVYAGAPHDDIPETHRTCATDPADPYAHTKALADALVLAANRPPGLRTVSLRVAHMYGPRCSQELRLALDLAGPGPGRRVPFVRLGPGTNLMEVVSVDNAAAAHVVAAKALVEPSRAAGRVDGEAFNVSDGEPVAFGYLSALYWSAAKGRDVAPEAIVVPAWPARAVFRVLRWLLWVFTLGCVPTPPLISTTAESYTLENRTYSSKKAREVLGFRPTSHHAEVIKQAVLEELKRRESEKSAM